MSINVIKNFIVGGLGGHNYYDAEETKKIRQEEDERREKRLEEDMTILQASKTPYYHGR
jgi:hypothetical protein